MFDMTLEEKLEVLGSVQGSGPFGFAAETIKEANVKSRKTGKPVPAHLAKVHVYSIGTVAAGIDYQATVNKLLTKEGKNPTFVAQQHYAAPVHANGLALKHKTKESYYLRVYTNLGNCTQGVAIFDAHGNKLSREEWLAIRDEYFDEPSENKSQKLDNPLEVRNYGLERVKYLKRGEVHINEITEEIAARLKEALKNRGTHNEPAA